MRRNHIASLLLTLTLSACGGGGDYNAPANHAPIAIAGPAQGVTAGSSVKLAGSGTDADQDILSYSWTLTKPAGSTAALLNYHVATPTFFADLPGVYVATLTVNDGKLDSAPSSVVITAQ
ncbi:MULTISPECIES: PKD domain-containing protein [unclassified Duganella]|uniref:PKD domain-containing protein n=1 Tax=unclassified Duganella TaxID=2636909 RepID=UPI000E34F948|nr:MULTISPECIES: PKD domain-containing protein [unclassified Duganella]RFP15006.1 PKD domain containing protein [Duganella sp. BJB475]RFP31356.1 PKD domain containing protein [Duganella sp. BJB476]